MALSDLRARNAKRKASRLLAATLAGIVCVSISATPASAHWNGTGQLIARIGLYPYNYNDTWQKPMNKALANWNATSSPADIYKNRNSGSTITVKSYRNTWYGHYTRCGDSCLYIKLNSRTINRDASNFSNYVTGVFVHELGHALNLAHNSTTSIMNSSRNRDTMTKPQSHDVSDVNAYY
ncbi:matrixin family metalloprotease [[Actinomadura] parvosata]|uniref:matrixin family metalloprotease n=1 Tax=[Actinomadura] parvosata TaxID=1955412 RepID=UPI0012BB4966|nr:matrixin family metalloprotease [Nonomuraea sp. ATCC 55076]